MLGELSNEQLLECLDNIIDDVITEDDYGYSEVRREIEQRLKQQTEP